MKEDKKKSEYRCLTPQEIAIAVAMFRKMAGMKQLTLAHEAGIQERTVQRIEHGEKVNDETLRRVAKALRLDENAFVGPRNVPSLEEAVSSAEKLFSEMLLIEASEFSTVKDCAAVLGGQGYLVDDQHVMTELAGDVATFKDLLEDWGTVYNDAISNTDRLQACESLLKLGQKIEAAGYRIRYGVYNTDDKFRVSALVILPKDDERATHLKQMLVPRRFAEMAWTSLRA